MSEVYHAERMRSPEFQDKLTPMIVHPQSLQHFYVNEVAKLVDGRFVIPIRWIIRKKELCADVYELRRESDVSSSTC